MSLIPEIQIEQINQDGFFNIITPYTDSIDKIGKNLLDKVYDNAGIDQILPTTTFSETPTGKIESRDAYRIILTGDSIVTVFQEPQKRILSETRFRKRNDGDNVIVEFSHPESCQITRIPKPLESNYYRVSLRFNEITPKPTLSVL